MISHIILLSPHDWSGFTSRSSNYLAILSPLFCYSITFLVSPFIGQASDQFSAPPLPAVAPAPCAALARDPAMVARTRPAWRLQGPRGPPGPRPGLWRGALAV